MAIAHIRRNPPTKYTPNQEIIDLREIKRKLKQWQFARETLKKNLALLLVYARSLALQIRIEKEKEKKLSDSELELRMSCPPMMLAIAYIGRN